MNELPQKMHEMLMPMFMRRSLPCLDERIVLQRIARKVERAFERMSWVEAGGVQVVCQCAGVVCRDGEKRYVDTGLVGIELPKFGDENLYDRLMGNWVN